MALNPFAWLRQQAAEALVAGVGDVLVDAPPTDHAATVASGLHCLYLRESGQAQRDQFAKTHLTAAGRRLYRDAIALVEADGELEQIETLVSQAVATGYAS